MKRLIQELQDKIGKFYYVYVALLWIAVAYYVPYIMEYYVTREWESFSDLFLVLSTGDTKYFIFGSIILFFIMLFVYLFTWNLGISVSVTTLTAFILSYASRIKYVNRKELLNYKDLMLTEAAGMATQYLKIELSDYLYFMLGAFVLMISLAFVIELLGKEYKKRKNTFQSKKAWIIRIVSVVLCVVAVMGYVTVFMGEQSHVEVVAEERFFAEENEKYVIYRFLDNNFVGFGNEGVQESYDTILAKAEEVSNQEGRGTIGDVTPNIIVIMNESWWNTDHIDSGHIKFSQDPMAVYHELEEECISGNVSVNVYGGGTVSSETEFLTGLNTKYFTTSSGFNTTTEGRSMPSIIQYFNALDYNTIAIHPYYGEFYSRDEVYVKYGFDKCVFDDDMKYTDIYSRYISDESLVNQIIYEYENGGDEADFIWAISIANHRRSLEYKTESVEDYNYPIDVELVDATLTEENYSILENYINGIYLSNLAYKSLMEYFSEVDEPTIILMYGDHIPNFSDETLNVLGLDLSPQSQEMKEALFTTPVLLWSNYDTGWEGDGPTGQTVNYLNKLLVDYAGLPKSNMTNIIGYTSSLIKADTRFYTLDVNGRELSALTEEQTDMLMDFRVVQYDIMLGDLLCEDIWNPISEVQEQVEY